MARLLIQIPNDQYRRLQLVAARDDRTPDRQAAHILRRSLAGVRLAIVPPAPTPVDAAPPTSHDPADRRGPPEGETEPRRLNAVVPSPDCLPALGNGTTRKDHSDERTA